jgi:molybdate transport system ATP-binding protein
VVAVLGPNGAGKTTLLRALAGLVALERGRVVLDEEILDDPVGEVWIPTEQRSIGYVFQDHLLFPHLDALDNVAFGLRCRGMGRREARAVAGSWLERLDLAEHAQARPRALSGGQAQRVALARALAPGPRLVLLDDPLAALDAATRGEVRSELRRHLAGVEGVRLLVTHDPVDAMVLADRLVIVEDGRMIQSGTPTEISRRPRSAYAARLVGRNLLAGRVVANRVRLDGGGELHVAGHHAEGGRVHVAVRPQSVALFRARPDGTPRNVWSGEVTTVEREGDRVRVEVAGVISVVAEVTTEAVAELGLHQGAEVWVGIKATEIDVYAA